MSDYQQCRALGEEAIKTTGVPATLYDPGMWWGRGITGRFFQPLFKFLEWIPFTSKKAKALRLVTLKQMLKALSYAIENPPVKGIEIMEIDTINRM